jgi:uncharacterized protein YyaL (SSP411 family)
MNRLAQEKSAYLKHAARQKIDWYPWSEEPFQRAQREDKPVFLSTGAVWCHWCHVMAEECFENDEIVQLMNRLFVNIKLDRDERPDIDRRYQQAVSAMGAGGGWPLSVFLTPDKKPFFGGTYFPPEDRQGRPGFKNVLGAVSNFYKVKREEAENYALEIMETLKPEALQPGELSESFLDDAATGMLSQADPENGGFGTAPKFPMPGALEFLIRRSFMGRSSSIGLAVRKTLESMARGGFHDQLGGGFHRYSVDASWIVPHFEKMADDNAWLLRNYCDAFAVSGDERLKDVARGIIRFVREVLSDPEGGFYASQDADVTPGDEGGYFTWTDEDLKRVLTDEEYRVLSLHFFHERGSLHHDPAKKVLFVVMEPGEIAEKLGMAEKAVAENIGRGKRKLLTERDARQTPFVDTTLYTSLNGMLISSCFRAFRVLNDPWLLKFAVKSLDRILRERLIKGVLFHSEGITAVLDDHINLIDALVAAYEATGEERYLSQADELMERCREKFEDKGHGGFFDTEDEVLGTRLKRIEDIPHPSANSLAAMLLLKLSLMTAKESYSHAAEDTLKLFSREAQAIGVHAGSFFCALDAYFHLLKLSVEISPTSELAAAARSLAGPYTAVVYGEDKGRIIPCVNNVCAEPLGDAGALHDFFEKRYTP